MDITSDNEAMRGGWTFEDDACSFEGGAACVPAELALEYGMRVVELFSSDSAFAALKMDGSVVTWGYEYNGGDSSGVDLTDVQTIFSTGSAFAALKTDGSVVTWGYEYNGGDSSGVDLTDVQTIFSTGSAFAALKTDGSVVTWGSGSAGGDQQRGPDGCADHLQQRTCLCGTEDRRQCGDMGRQLYWRG